MPVSVTALYTLDSLQLLSQIESAPSEGQAKKILIDAIINKIADLMGTDKGGIDPKALLFSFGLNSMQVVQLKTWMDNALPVTLSITQMNQYATIASLVELLLEAMSSKTAGDLEAVGLSTPSGNDIETQNGQLLLEGAGQRSLLKVNEVADPDLVAFIFPSIAPAGNVASTVREQASKLVIPNEDQIQMCIVQMPYSSQPGHPIDWAKNTERRCGDQGLHGQGLEGAQGRFEHVADCFRGPHFWCTGGRRGGTRNAGFLRGVSCKPHRHSYAQSRCADGAAQERRECRISGAVFPLYSSNKST